MSPKSPWNYSNIHLSFEQAHKAYKTLQRYAGEVETAPKAPFEAQVGAWLSKAEATPKDDYRELYKQATEKTIARMLNPTTEADKSVPLESNLRSARIFLGYVNDDAYVDDALQRVTKAAQHHHRANQKPLPDDVLVGLDELEAAYGNIPAPVNP